MRTFHTRPRRYHIDNCLTLFIRQGAIQQGLHRLVPHTQRAIENIDPNTQGKQRIRTVKAIPA
ncbi:hypothetical protein D3C72_2569610 [compost metagenome]